MQVSLAARKHKHSGSQESTNRLTLRARVRSYLQLGVDIT